MLTDDERKYFEKHYGDFTNIDIELYFKPVADRDSEEYKMQFPENYAKWKKHKKTDKFKESELFVAKLREFVREKETKK